MEDSLIIAGIQVGNEFGAVEALWSQFENVMGKDTEPREDDEAQGQEGREERKGDSEDGAKE